jgi:hypothetical protein
MCIKAYEMSKTAKNTSGKDVLLQTQYALPLISVDNTMYNSLY